MAPRNPAITRVILDIQNDVAALLAVQDLRGVVDQEHVFRVDPVPAKRAGGVGVEPRVDALDVEGVLALGEETEDLGPVEPGQADGALEPLLLTSERPEPENG